MKWWYGRMIGMCQYGFRVKWCNYFFRFPNGEMLKPVYGVMVIWWNCSRVDRFLWDKFPSIAKWWRKSTIKWIIWLDLTVAWFISYVSVSLILYQNTNDGHPDKYGVDHLCYLWCLLVYLLFYRSTSPFSTMVKYCDGEMIPDGAVMMVRLFRPTVQFWRWSEFIVGVNFVPPGQLSWGTIFVGENFFFPGKNPVGRSREFWFPRTILDNTWHTIGT